MAIDIRGLAPLLQVFDMPASVRFYRDKLGFEIVGTDGKPPDSFDWVLLRLNGVELMLNTAYETHDRPPAPDPARIAAHGDTGIFFGCPDVDAMFAYLRARGVNVKEPTITSYGFKSFSLKDPDGYDLVFHWPVASKKAVFKTAAPYADDAMNLPVRNVDAAVPFYESIMGFHVVSQTDAPRKSVVLGRDDIQIGLAENGGDPTQEGCFFEVDNVEAAFAEFRSNGLEKEEAGFRIDQHGATSFRVFFVVAPDGLCYCLGQRQDPTRGPA